MRWSRDVVPTEHLHLEHDGKILLVDNFGNGPQIPVRGRETGPYGSIIRLPSPEEARSMGIEWEVKRVNRINLSNKEHVITYGTPLIQWPEGWAWKDWVISDSCVDPVTRESVYTTLHRVVSKVIISNSKEEILMAKVSRGFFTGCWTLPGGFADYSEHPREAAKREAFEEVGVDIDIPDPLGELGTVIRGDDHAYVQTAIFNEQGINWVSFTYTCETDLNGQEITPKEDEIEEVGWFTPDQALNIAVSIFDIEAIKNYTSRVK